VLFYSFFILLVFRQKMILTKYLFALYMSTVDAIILTLLKSHKIGMVKGFWVFPLAFIVYGFQSIMFYFGLSFGSMTVLNVLWDVISDVLVSLIGVYFFGETLNTIQCVGLVLALTGITLLGAHDGDSENSKKDE
jgi:multidrug transporter EmrE-like cation transporter